MNGLQTQLLFIKVTGMRSMEGIRTFLMKIKELEEIVPANSGRELNREYQEKLFKHVAVRMVTKTCFPFWLRAVYTTAKAVHYVFKGDLFVC